LSPAGRAATLDQSHVIQPDPTTAAYGHVNEAGDRAQTFTVGLGGRLDRLDLQVFRAQTEPLLVPLRVEIRGTSGGVPLPDDAPVLASAALAPESVPYWNNGVSQPVVLTPVDLSASNLVVSPGDVLAIVLRSSAPAGSLAYAWQFQPTPGGGYAAGTPFSRERPVDGETFRAEHAQTDRGFQTYVTVPEPAAAALLLLLVVPAIVGRRRRG
jgi:hypothetical protein